MSTETKSPSANRSKTSFAPKAMSTAAIYRRVFSGFFEKTYPKTAPKAAGSAAFRFEAETAATPKGAIFPKRNVFDAAKQ
ncbi:MAG: hypothetical protein J6J07_09370, partial [Oscillospiraceae bacterium]|nr:hypothetical protein [Oscillospiraceae bacterium]